MNHFQQTVVYRLERAGARGIPSDVLMDFMYRLDRDGGPLCARKSMHVRIWRINKHLKKEGRAIRASHGDHSSCGVYRICVI